jgi:2-polyprenyl-3-methyl-5-hydroxy-6-metoxy-1,4-benzoquinol methylase
MVDKTGIPMPEELTKCLLCASARLKKDAYAASLLNLADLHGVTKCQDCGFRFLSPRPMSDDYLQAYAYGSGPLVDIYKVDSSFYGEEDMIRMPQYLKKLDILTKVGAKGRLLEIGSCTGAFLNEARKRGFQVEGIEPSEENTQIAKRKYGLDLRNGRVEDFSFPEESFDVVFSSHVFEHLLDPLAVAKKLSSWLRTGGFHMIEVPNQFDTLGTRRRRLLRITTPRERTFLSIHHPVFFSPKTLQRLAEMSGCRKCSMRNVYYSCSGVPRLPKVMVHELLALIFGGANIEIIARKLG